MKFLQELNDTSENRISLVFLSLFLFTFPFDRFYSQIIFSGFLIHTIIHLKKRNLERLKNPVILLLISFYLLVITGTAYTAHRQEALQNLEKQAGLLLIPLSLAISNINLARYRVILLKVFCTGCIAACIYLYLDALRIIFYNNLPVKSLFSTHFLNQNFSAPIGMHATYLSMYNAVSIIFLLSIILKENRKYLVFIYSICILVLYAALVQLGSKAAIISLLVILNLVFPFMALSNKARSRFFIFSFLNTALLVFVILNVTSYSKRFVAGLRNEFVPASVSNTFPEPRTERWKLALDIGSESLLYGHGTGSEKELLKEKYFQNKLYHSYLHELNAHNQYLSLLITHGIPGVFLFMLIIVRGYISAIRRRDIVFTGFLVICSIISFSENILSVNKGIFFFGFFLSFLILSDNSGKNPDPENDSKKGNL